MQKGTLLSFGEAKYRLAACAITAFASFMPASASFAAEMQWKQTLDIPVGKGMPQGVSADILGIQIGDSYDVAKSKVEKIIAGQPDGAKASMQEFFRAFQMQVHGGEFVETKYPSQLQLKIDGGTTEVDEEIHLHFSAPSSGAQLYSIERHIWYNKHEVQPRISDLLASLTQKYKATPFDYVADGSSVTRAFVFDDGRALTPAPNTKTDCTAMGALPDTEDYLRTINYSGKCDIVLSLQTDYGISDDHAEYIRFDLGDAERAKANAQADYQYFRDYVSGLASGTAGTGPKL